MSKYTDKAAVENYLLKTIDNSFNEQIDEWIEAMSREVDIMANRTIASDELETYKYDGDGTELLVIKDCHDIEEVKVNGGVVAVLEYPTNKGYTSRIVLTDGEKFTAGRQNVEVTAKQGMFEVPPTDVKLATTVLVAGICNNQIFGAETEAKSETIGNYSVSYTDGKQSVEFNNALSKIKGYRRITL